MYPDPPYAGFTWPLTQHMGVSTAKNLYHILLAAARFSDFPDPTAEINSYMIANNLLTANVRADSGQPDAWRDYQQILSELGLIFSTEVVQRITPTPLGLAYLDGSLGFSELMTLQAFRYQYPNGHKSMIDHRFRETLRGTPLYQVQTLMELQRITGVLIHPAVLIWQVLRRLREHDVEKILTVDEIITFLMRCSTHADTDACVAAIARFRRGEIILEPMTRGRRNAQDWIKFLLFTPLFDGVPGRNAKLWISAFALDHIRDIDEMCSSLEKPASFWIPHAYDREERISWYARFGAIDLGIAAIPGIAVSGKIEADRDYPIGPEHDDDEEEVVGGLEPGAMRLRDFTPSSLAHLAETPPAYVPGTTIQSSYDSALVERAHSLHNQMVLLIGNICKEKADSVFEDPTTVDLLVEFRGTEFIIEVKSVNARNFTTRLRYALGQLLHYDYLRSTQSNLPRRRVLGLAAYIPEGAWCIPFLNTHLDFDLISLQGQTLRVDSRSPLTRDLFV